MPYSNTRMWPDQQRKLVRCDVVPKRLSTAKPDPVLMLDSQVLNPVLDSSVSGEVRAAGKVSTEEIGPRLATKKAPVWNSMPGVTATQVMSVQILYFLPTVYEMLLLYDMCGRNRLSMQSAVQRSCFYTADSKVLRTHECGRFGVPVQISDIFCGIAEKQVFACRISGKGDVIGSYYESPA